MKSVRFFLSLASFLSFVAFAVALSFCLSVFLSSCALEPAESSSAYVRQKENDGETENGKDESGSEKSSSDDEKNGEVSVDAGAEKSEVEDDEIGADWTVAVYMAADNSLEPDAINDINEMERVFVPAGMNVLVLFDRAEGYDASNDNWTDTRLFLIKHDADDSNRIVSKRLSSVELGLSENEETELDMSGKSTLSAFLSFARKNYTADKYALVVWGHGTGWRNSGLTEARAFAVDGGGGSSSYMTISSMRQAIESGMDDDKLSFLGFDTCFGCCLESAFEFRNLAEYMAGSTSIEPQSGWDYCGFFGGLDSDASVVTGENMCESALNQFRNQYDKCAACAFCTLDLSQCGLAVEAFNGFSAEAAARITSYEKRDTYLSMLKEKCVSYSAGTPGDCFADSLDFVRNACLYDDSLFECGKKVGDAYSLFVKNSWSVVSESGTCSPGVFVAVKKSEGVFSNHPSEYVSGNTSAEVSQFVSFASSYVPTKRKTGSFLDKLFYTTFDN